MSKIPTSSVPKPEIQQWIPAPKPQVSEGVKVRNILWYLTINSNKELEGEAVKKYKSTIEDLLYDKLYFLFKCDDPNDTTDPDLLIPPKNLLRMRVMLHHEWGKKIGRLHTHALIRVSVNVPGQISFQADSVKEYLKETLGYTIYIKPKVTTDSIQNIEDYINKTMNDTIDNDTRAELVNQIISRFSDK